MGLFIVLLAMAIYFVWFVQKVVRRTEKKIIGKIIEYTKPVDVLKGLGTAVAGNLFLKFKENLGMK